MALIIILLVFLVVMGLVYRHYTKDMLDDYEFMMHQAEDTDKDDGVQTYEAYSKAANSLPKNVGNQKCTIVKWR